MDIAGYLRIVRIHWVALIVLALVGGGVAYGWTLLQTKVYAANASAIISAGSSTDLGTALVGDNLAKSRSCRTTCNWRGGRRPSSARPGRN